MGTEELSTSFSAAGVTEETEIQSHTGQRWHFKVLFVHSSTVREIQVCVIEDYRSEILQTETQNSSEKFWKLQYTVRDNVKRIKNQNSFDIHCLQHRRTHELADRETVLRQRIEHLKRDRAAICRPSPRSGVKDEMSLNTGHLAGSRGGHVTKDIIKPLEAKKEKASVFYELISVRVGAVHSGSLAKFNEGSV